MNNIFKIPNNNFNSNFNVNKDINISDISYPFRVTKNNKYSKSNKTIFFQKIDNLIKSTQELITNNLSNNSLLVNYDFTLKNLDKKYKQIYNIYILEMIYILNYNTFIKNETDKLNTDNFIDLNIDIDNYHSKFKLFINAIDKIKVYKIELLNINKKLIILYNNVKSIIDGSSFYNKNIKIDNYLENPYPINPHYNKPSTSFNFVNTNNPYNNICFINPHYNKPNTSFNFVNTNNPNNNICPIPDISELYKPKTSFNTINRKYT